MYPARAGARRGGCSSSSTARSFTYYCVVGSYHHGWLAVASLRSRRGAEPPFGTAVFERVYVGDVCVRAEGCLAVALRPTGRGAVAGHIAGVMLGSEQRLQLDACSDSTGLVAFVVWS